MDKLKEKVKDKIENVLIGFDHRPPADQLTIAQTLNELTKAYNNINRTYYKKRFYNKQNKFNRKGEKRWTENI